MSIMGIGTNTWDIVNPEIDDKRTYPLKLSRRRVYLADKQSIFILGWFVLPLSSGGEASILPFMC